MCDDNWDLPSVSRKRDNGCLHSRDTLALVIYGYFMDIVEKMKKSDTWGATRAKDIFEKMKNWDTWDAMEKDLKPYMDEVVERMLILHESVIQDFYIFELIILPKADVEVTKALDELDDRENPLAETYRDVVVNIMKLHHNSDKFNDVLEAQTQISEYEKERIREDWEKQHAIETKGDENLVVEDLGEYLKARCDELAECNVKVDDINLRRRDICKFNWTLGNIRRRLECQKIIYQGPSALHAEHKERVQSMMAEDNTCSSTQAKKLRASSEDNACSPKRLRQDECY